MRTAILQPTYFPWLGYFELIDAVEQLVVFDHVQFCARSWQQRNRVRTPHGVRLLTVPVLSDGRQDVAIKDKRIDHGQPWVRKHVRTLGLAYRRAPYFEEHFEPVRRVLQAGHERLVDLTLGLLRLLLDALGICTRVVRSSALLAGQDHACDGRAERGRTDRDRTDRVVSLCRLAGATTLYDGASAAGFLAPERFAQQGIELEFQRYQHPVYPQQGLGFVPYMGVIDLLLNCGPDSLGIIRAGAGRK